MPGGAHILLDELQRMAGMSHMPDFASRLSEDAVCCDCVHTLTAWK
jgi:hypothetical protein